MIANSLLIFTCFATKIASKQKMESKSLRSESLRMIKKLSLSAAHTRILVSP